MRLKPLKPNVYNDRNEIRVEMPATDKDVDMTLYNIQGMACKSLTGRGELTVTNAGDVHLLDVKSGSSRKSYKMMIK